VTVPIKIPDLGAAVDDVTLVRWLVEEGDVIVRGQKIAEVETDKALVALESVAAGVLLKKLAVAGQDATTGDIIAYVGSPDDIVPDASDAPPAISAPPAPARLAPSRETSKPRVTPMLRNFAKQKGVDIDAIIGTGRDGMVTRQDILDAAGQ
jgi:pyruvate/2-oxoglutarate dehydrogenase complex dihydrolipoamide acyltransferase (E2) component